MRKSLLIATMAGLAAAAFSSSNPVRSTPAPSPAPKRGKLAKAEKKAAKLARSSGVLASEYLAQVESDPRRAAALQRARDRATLGVRVGAPSVPPSEKT